MTAAPSMPAADTAAESLRTIGTMVCLHAQLELAMRRLIDVLVHGTGGVGTEGLTDRYRFQPPMRPLRELVLTRYANEPLKARKFRRWRNRVNKLLARRNTMIHSAWIDEQGSLRFRRYPRSVGAPPRELCGSFSSERIAIDMRFLQLDIETIEAWIGALQVDRPVGLVCTP